ncbi:hypothetical protein LOTGIDRAFT_228961 [Lottia gigantea]|uniref:Tubulin polymerization-promoting protein family member 3 n=1 Tax=Lottia gigantea TaxID=225164 RepID=V4BKB5_LOTGI|nr:hypothetical protein LOTGIDRAFT_228961 [Lottia gigantea]ESO89019.1 hypothetical protein LOTGIDRAFT_228961 [Lottia gigantea]
MAASSSLSSEDMDNLAKYFERCNLESQAAGSKKLPEEKLKFATGKAVMKMVEPVMGAANARFCENSVIVKLSDRTTKKMSQETFKTTFIPELASYAVKNIEALKKKGTTQEEYQTKLLEGIKKELNKEKKVAKDAAVVNRLTDASGYTGSHKERFDADGKGKGGSGRKDEVVNTGYVGNYKNAGTYANKK